jgi:tetratricopeptide (TPR) repeat protein
MLRMAQTQRNPVMLLWGHYSLGFTLSYQGQLRSARDHLERSLALYDTKKGGTYGFVQDPGPTAMALLSHVIHSLGYPDQALEKIRKALTLARDLSHPFTLAWVLGSAGELYWRRGEKLTAQELMEERLTLCDQQNFKPMSASAVFLLGLASVEQGGGERALTKMHDSLRGAWAGVSNGDKIRALGLLALAQGKAGQVELGLATVDEAFASAKTQNDASFLDLHRYLGQLLLMKNKDGFRKAKQSFRTAIELARKRNAKSDELSAVTELARLLAQEGRRDQARKTLTGIYNWFTEGFDTADLKDAKALLDELSG